MSIQCVVPVSGGKDSQACLKLALETYPADRVRGLFCDTKFEHPLTYEHVERLRTMYGEVQIDTVNAGTVTQKVLNYGRFPDFRSRFCTDELKIRPTKRYLKALAEQQGEGFEVWYGMRLGESTVRAKRYAGMISSELHNPHELLPTKYPKYLARMGVQFRLPVIEWSELAIKLYLDGEMNPLYDQGFDRVGCFPCLAAGDKWKRKAFEHDEFGRQQYAKVITIAKWIDKSPWTSKEELATCQICSI